MTLVLCMLTSQRCQLWRFMDRQSILYGPYLALQASFLKVPWTPHEVGKYEKPIKEGNYKGLSVISGRIGY